jgi:mono/diheme cytochrome c family protein
VKQAGVAFAGLALLAGLIAAAVAAEPSSGKELVERLGCLGCHTMLGKGGGRGPVLDGVGARLTPHGIKKQIVTPRGRMPSFAQLKPEELEALVQYLAGLS